MSVEARFKISGASGVFCDIDMLDSSMTGFPRSEVVGVKYSSYFPLTPYLKSGVANHWGHACYGSGAFYVERIDGRVLVISPVFFADKNLDKKPGHFSGLQHWNTEFFRYYLGEEEAVLTKRLVPKGTQFDIHQIKKAGWLGITAMGTGFSVKNRIEWKD
jgi:hypothetical protein